MNPDTNLAERQCSRTLPSIYAYDEAKIEHENNPQANMLRIVLSREIVWKSCKRVDDSTSRSCAADMCATGQESVAPGLDRLHHAQAIDLLVEEIDLYALTKGDGWREGNGAAIKTLTRHSQKKRETFAS